MLEAVVVPRVLPDADADARAQATSVRPTRQTPALHRVGPHAPGLLGGERVDFTAQMYLDDEAAIAGGREHWGFPKKHGRPTRGRARTVDRHTRVCWRSGRCGHHRLQAPASALRCRGPQGLLGGVDCRQEVSLPLITRPGVNGRPRSRSYPLAARSLHAWAAGRRNAAGGVIEWRVR